MSSLHDLLKLSALAALNSKGNEIIVIALFSTKFKEKNCSRLFFFFDTLLLTSDTLFKSKFIFAVPSLTFSPIYLIFETQTDVSTFCLH